MLKGRTVSAYTLGMHHVVDNHIHSFVCFLGKIQSKNKTETRSGKGGGGHSEKFYTRRLRLEVRPLTILYIPFLTEKVPLSYT